MLLATFVFSLFLNFQNGVNSENILAIMTVASPSHSLWNTVLINELASKGHNLTVLIADLPRNSNDFHINVRYIHMPEIYTAIAHDSDIGDFIQINAFEMMIGYCTYSLDNCEGSLKSKEFLKFMEQYKNEKYDLILYDYTMGPCLLGLVHIYDYPPLISVSAFPYPPVAYKFIGGHFHPSYISFHSAMLDPQNNFIDRMFNHVLFMAEELSRYYFMTPKMDEMVRKVFPKDMPYLGDLEKLSTIALIGSHPAISQAQPLPQNIIEIGGLNLIDPKPLPKNIEDFINESLKGAVLFSLGTNMQPKNIGAEKAEKLLNAMENLPEYNFMWKFDINFIKRKLPKNVLIQNFFPQRDILANPKVKCFVTHAGGLSTQESIWYAVPMVTIPLFADQIRNSKMAVVQEFAVELEFSKLNEKSFYNALSSVLNDLKYSKNIKLQSKRFRDRPMKPLDTAVWWIEYILRHPNPDHLRVPTLEMGFIAANSYDFILIVLIIFAIIIYINVKIIQCLCCQTSKNVEGAKLKKH